MPQHNRNFEQFQLAPREGPFDHPAYNVDSIKRFALGDLDRNVIAAGGNIFSTKRRRNSSGSLTKGWGLLPGSTTIERFAGDGSDGELNISSGTTTIDANSATVVVKQYKKISITGTAVLTISNAASTGTILVLKSQGDVTITSSATAAIDMSAMGGSGGAAVSSGNNVGNAGTDGKGSTHRNPAGSGGTSSAGTGGSSDLINLINGLGYPIIAAPGGGGGSGGYGAASGSGTSGAGSKGGGAIIIECGGRYKCTGTITVAGANGSAHSAGGVLGVGGGGGGAGGTMIILYNDLLSDTGTYTVSGGSGGGGSGAGNNNYYGGGGGASLKNNGSAGGASGGSGGDGGAGEAIRMINSWIA